MGKRVPYYAPFLNKVPVTCRGRGAVDALTFNTGNGQHNPSKGERLLLKFDERPRIKEHSP